MRTLENHNTFLSSQTWLSTIKYRIDALWNATSKDETEEEILTEPSRGHTSQLRTILVLTRIYSTQFYITTLLIPTLAFYNIFELHSEWAPSSQPLCIKQGITLTSEGHHTVPTTRTNLPEEGGQKSYIIRQLKTKGCQTDGFVFICLFKTV